MEPPRIAYLLKKFPRLSETFILNELLALEQGGLALRVLSRRPPDDEPRHPQLAGLRAPVEVLPSSSELDPWSELFAAEPEPEALFGRLGSTVREAREWGHPRLPRLLSEAIYLHRRCRELGLDHLHVHFATESAVTALLLKRLGGPTYSLTSHAKDIYRDAVDRPMLARLVAESEFTVTVCDANVRALEERVAPHSEAAVGRIRRLYNGIDLAAFASDGGRRRPDRILSVGRLVEKKGFEVLIDALGLLRDGGTGFEALIAGDGELRPALEERVEALGLADRVRLVGPVDQGRVRALLAESTVFCLPCLVGEDGNRDALPTVLLEALASGVPVVSTPVTGIPEILAGGRAGELVPERDPRATADALARLLGDPDRRRALSAAGLAHARENFDQERSARTLRAWFDRVGARAVEACA